MLTTPQEYVDTMDSMGKEWLVEFLSYMDKTYSHIQPIMFRQRPMYKVGKSYVLFAVAKEHFTVHTLDFDIIEKMKTILPKSKFGKGCVKVKFTDKDAIPHLKTLCDEVVKSNQ
jgi:hypothetical protein